MSAEASDPKPADPRSKARRELATTVILCAAGALVELFAAGRPWFRTTGATIQVYAGTAAASALKPLAFVALAGAAALLATKRWGRVAVGVILVATAFGIAVAVDAAKAPKTAGHVQHLPAWPVVAAVAVIPILLAGLAAAARGNRWSVMSERYDAPGAERPKAQDPDAALWDALDRGDDPTG